MSELVSRLSQLQSVHTKLSRDITLFGAISIIIGIMVGSGIFYLGSFVLMRAGFSLGLSLVVWALGGVVTLIAGISYAELGAMMPKAGGSYVYLREAYGKAVAFTSGFSGFILGSSGSIAALALAFTTIFTQFLPLSEPVSKLLAVAIIVGLTFINYVGVKFGSWIQNVFTVAKLVPIFIILFLGLFMGQQVPNLSVVPTEPVNIFTFISMIAFAVVATLWAYEGWMNLNTVSEELKNPQRNIPLALISAILFVSVLYVMFNFSIYRVLSFDQIMSEISAGNYFLGTAVAAQLLGGLGTLLVGVGMLVSVFGATNGCIMVFPRTYYAMAQDGLFFKQIGKVHPTYKTPSNAILLSAVVSIILVFTRNLGQLTSLVIFQSLAYNTLIFFSVILLRRKYPTLERPYKVWGYPIVPMIATLTMVGLLINTLVSDFTTSVIGLVIPAIALVVYFIINNKQRQIEV